MLIEMWETIHQHIEWGSRADLYLKMFLDEHSKHLEPDSRALDLGCGVGANCGLLLRHGFEVWANDCSQTAITKTIKNYPGENLHTLVSSFESLTFNDKFFDLIISIASIEQLNSLDLMIELVQKARKWLKPNGKIFFKLLTEPTDQRLFRAPVHLSSEADIAKLMGGFDYHTARTEGITTEGMEFFHFMVLARPK
jgi:2-polyprenyl-3-methyl-5-hydroxy-6-metoxy-1,4-benzoquinol methylase